ncbi:MAG: hypothetical protein P8H25_00900 [Flavobacteriaceae bacterium]|nr:hypothetical protein [Flavobacteriaceae bacterium]
MKRLIVDYKKLTAEILDLVVSQYPYGFDDDIIEFKLASGEIVEAIEVRSEDTVYLVKIGSKLAKAIKEYEDTVIENDDEFTHFEDDQVSDDETLEE